ncbi:MAG: glycosyltransferase family 39 protein [Candidatus Omnitrophica bacterium]|nr:glycosyltransferase family 39 protein [Candidatus Omnitrophota bacterium]
MTVLKRITPWQWALIVLLFILAGYLRFAHLTEQGFLYWDEGMYMNEAKFYSSLWDHKSYVIDKFMRGLGPEHLIDTIDGWPSSAVKPLHGLMIFFFSFVIGLHDYTGQVFSAVCALACLWLLFVLIARYSSVPHALITLLILAVSPYHIMFSRATFPEMDSALFYYASLLLYFKTLPVENARKRTLFAAGMLFGCTLVTNYRWFILIPSFALFDLINTPGVFKTGKFSFVKRMFFLGSGLASVVAVIDLPYVLVKQTMTLPIEFSSYHTQAVYYVSDIFMKLRTLTLRPLYFNILLESNGYLLICCLGLGTLALLLKKDKTPFERSMLVLFYYVFIGISIVEKGYFARNYSIVYPAAAFIMAYGVRSFIQCCFKRAAVRNAVLGTLVIAILIRGSVAAQPFVHIRSGYREARDYLASVGGKNCLATTNSVFEFYFGRNVADHFYAHNDYFLRDMERKPFSHIVVDYVQFLVHQGGVIELYDYLRTHRKPVKIIANPMGDRLPVVLESARHCDHPGDTYSRLMNDPHTREIRIYSTEGLVEELKGHNT